MASKSLADKLASLANPEPVFDDPEIEDDVTSAKVAVGVAGRMFQIERG
jgi:hypothetical protein